MGEESAPIKTTDQTAWAAIVVPVLPHFRTGIWLYWRDPPPVQSDQLIATGADSSPATSLSLSIYNLLRYGQTYQLPINQ